jgi:hypothetical protein
VLNQGESAVDCGGPNCSACGVGRNCNQDGDCTSKVCDNGTCQAPTCNDQTKNQQEIGVDCGGPNCSLCSAGKSCQNDGNCQSGVCENGTCQAPTCNDQTQNQNETAVDCGGPNCSLCSAGKNCTEDGNCQSGVCENGTCQAPTCKDQTQNQKETDIDCGGPNCSTCTVGEACQSDGDCQTKRCKSGTCRPAIVTGKRTQKSPGRWSDGTYADSCQSYRRPPSKAYAYKGSTGSGRYRIRTGKNQTTVVRCEMKTQKGGWTLAATLVNDKRRKWDKQSVFENDSTFGSIGNRRKRDYKSKAWSEVEADDLMIVTKNYYFGFTKLFGNKTFADHFKQNWPSRCNDETWMRSGADFAQGLTDRQRKTYGFTYRGEDLNADDCFPGGNENAAVSVMAEGVWVDGLGNTPNGGNRWSSHDHSILEAGNINPTSCSGSWPCNDNGLRQNENGQCYDTSCKVTWVEVYVR